MSELAPYLWSYFAVGLLLTVIALFRRGQSERWRIAPICFILLFWPLFLLLTPEFIVKRYDDLPRKKKKTWQELIDASPEDFLTLTDEEKLRVELTVSDGEEGTTFFPDFADFQKVLKSFWEQDIPPQAYRSLKDARWRLSESYREAQNISYSLAEPDWYVGFSAEFVKSISRIDKNKRARVLEAITKLTDAPFTVHGDTVKPLTGNLSGLWRYRIGDDRLIYKVITSTNQIVLMSFSSRGSVYE
ncbi:type II toxin-antitoxin system RelE family toxin [Herminiimonas fonticola]|uniref:Addiction module RelE/StbE family toxin n=1 Tax=Herminiimonas fonticola TaxID=303380 RepID=A0A4R6GJJ9_9BURK|nr:type II toxin-antitoxin system RelE/ParE family toxin [Herminiimonas fonticola]RBA25497.1 hypothetical protein Hfont_1130 [Herminiimonas fonticola]TDN94610.1 addiction module RelE/StbE family toxin [Herminiimonas fonticola]